ncbi:MAG: hypothetical protein EAX81_04630 [Candidatus Thorarchaeota archaeon]|nr:hypothetical protein [Candidatus Thorarchaeota archaeon]
MKPTAKQVAIVRDFINSQTDPSRVEDFDENFGIYFLAIELASLAFAIFQIDNLALSFNLGLVVFIIGGVLSFSYELAKKWKSITFRLMVCQLLYIYGLTLVATLVALIPLYFWFLVSSLFFAVQEPGMVDLVILFLVSTPTVYYIQKYTKHLHHRWFESLEKSSRRKYALTDEEDGRRITLNEMLDLAVPKGFDVTLMVYVGNLLLVLSTLNNQPVYMPFLSQVIRQPLVWAISIGLIIPFLIVYYFRNRSESVRILDEFLKQEESRARTD